MSAAVRVAGQGEPASPGRRYGLMCLAAPLFMWHGLARAAGRDLPSPVSLSRALDAALARREPLVVMASLAGCPFCHVAREHYLWPLSRAGAAVVQINFRDPRPLRDWQGRPSSQADLVEALGIKVAPSVLFFGARGQELAPRLEGALLPDFYGAYLEERLAQARAAVRS
ncbi:thioredoxin domain-containing protein [Comamonas composti]|uniref:hypothetical protein n=1 Tax=Comamonas composti TaxID=408558 RepID=UPI0012EB8FA4|nr:hypothetical protein [Comamonas composti]